MNKLVTALFVVLLICGCSQKKRERSCSVPNQTLLFGLPGRTRNGLRTILKVFRSYRAVLRFI